MPKVKGKINIDVDFGRLLKIKGAQLDVGGDFGTVSFVVAFGLLTILLAICLIRIPVENRS